MSRAKVKAWRRCDYCGAATRRAVACEDCEDLLAIDPHHDGELGFADELAVDERLPELASERVQGHDPRPCARLDTSAGDAL